MPSHPPYNPYTQAKPPENPRESAPTPRGTVPLYYLTGLVSVLVLVALLVVAASDPQNVLVRFLFFGLLGTGCFLVFAKGSKARKSLGWGLLTGTVGTVAAVVAIVAPDMLG